MSKSTRTEVNSSNSNMTDLERRRIQNEALASFRLKLTDKAKKYRSPSISDQSKIKLSCMDTYMQSINDAIRCLEHMQDLGGTRKGAGNRGNDTMGLRHREWELVIESQGQQRGDRVTVKTRCH